MPQRFFGKTPHKKYVRPISNGRIPHKIDTAVNEVKKMEKLNTDENSSQIIDQTVEIIVEDIKETKVASKKKHNKYAATVENKKQETVSDNG